jgi:hypothetical protein
MATNGKLIRQAHVDLRGYLLERRDDLAGNGSGGIVALRWFT